MNWYKKAIYVNKFPSPDEDWFEKGAIFGYTETESLRSASIYLKPKIAATWGTKNGINHEEIFLLQQGDVDAFTWIYDIKRRKLDGIGFDIIPRNVRSAALSEAISKTQEVSGELV